MTDDDHATEDEDDPRDEGTHPLPADAVITSTDCIVYYDIPGKGVFQAIPSAACRGPNSSSPRTTDPPSD